MQVLTMVGLLTLSAAAELVDPRISQAGSCLESDKAELLQARARSDVPTSTSPPTTCPLPSPAQATTSCISCLGACINKNKSYKTLGEAWANCGKVPECGIVFRFQKNSRYYLRRSSDPNSSTRRCGEDYKYSCHPTTMAPGRRHTLTIGQFQEQAVEVALLDTVDVKVSSQSHDLWQAPNKQSYQMCREPFKQLVTSGPATFTFEAKTPGEFYFLCNRPGHCAGGVKATVKVACTQRQKAECVRLKICGPCGVAPPTPAPTAPTPTSTRGKGRR